MITLYCFSENLNIQRDSDQNVLSIFLKFYIGTSSLTSTVLATVKYFTTTLITKRAADRGSIL